MSTPAQDPRYPQTPPPGFGPPQAYPQQAYPQQAYPVQPYAYAYPYDPYAKSRLAAGLLGIFLGGFGVHRFYLGYTGIGVTQIIVTILTCGLGAWWGVIEGILILARSGFPTDASGRPLRE
jgi:TM2 domain-containing membrane protein YozV